MQLPPTPTTRVATGAIREQVAQMSARFLAPTAALLQDLRGLPPDQAARLANGLFERFSNEGIPQPLLDRELGSIRRVLRAEVLRDGPTLAGETSPSQLERFDLAWVRCLLEEALEVLEEEQSALSQARPYDVFMERYVSTSGVTDGEPARDARERFWRALELVILGTVVSEDSFVHEVGDLFPRQECRG